MLTPFSFGIAWPPQQRTILMRMIGLWRSAQPGGGFQAKLAEFNMGVQKGDETAIKARDGLEFAGFDDLLRGVTHKLGTRRGPDAFPRVGFTDDGDSILVDLEGVETMETFEPVLELFRGAMCATDRREALRIDWDGSWGRGPVVGTTLVRQSGVLHRTYDDLVYEVMKAEEDRVLKGVDVDPGHPIWGYVDRLFDIANDTGFVGGVHRSILNGDIERIASSEGRDVEEMSVPFVLEGQTWTTIREFAAALRNHMSADGMSEIHRDGDCHNGLSRLAVVERVIAFAGTRVEAEMALAPPSGGAPAAAAAPSL